MYAEILQVLAPILLCVATGFAWSKSGRDFDGDFISRLVINVGAPCLVIGTLSKVELPAQSLLQILAAAALVLVLTALLAALLCRLLKLSFSVYLNPLIFPNTVNMGLPVSFFAYGDQGLAVALGIYLVVSIAHFSFGIALVSGQNGWRNTLRSPIVYSGLIAAALVLTETRLPLWLESSFTLLGSFTIPLMLLTLGVSLAQLKVRDFALSGLLAVARLSIGLLVGLAAAELMALEGVIRNVVIIQSTMPAAVFNYLMAKRYHQSPEAVAGLVVVSTLLSFATLPLLLALIRHLFAGSL
jgi:predicted permease